MKKKKNKINRALVIILIVWFLIFITDMICFAINSHTLFAIPTYGGELITYIGLGYLVRVYVPLTSIDEPLQSSYDINFVPYIVINIVLIIVLVVRIISTHRTKTKNYPQKLF